MLANNNNNDNLTYTNSTVLLFYCEISRNNKIVMRYFDSITQNAQDFCYDAVVLNRLHYRYCASVCQSVCLLVPYGLSISRTKKLIENQTSCERLPVQEYNRCIYL